MPRIEVDLEKCSGCHICEQICSLTHFGVLNIYKARIRVFTEFGKDYVKHTVRVCRQCEDPACVKACPTGALKKVDGVIRVDEEKCVGCKACIKACPYGAAFEHRDVKVPLICTVCGACAEYCPMGAIRVVE